MRHLRIVGGRQLTGVLYLLMGGINSDGLSSCVSNLFVLLHLLSLGGLLFLLSSCRGSLVGMLFNGDCYLCACFLFLRHSCLFFIAGFAFSRELLLRMKIARDVRLSGILTLRTRSSRFLREGNLLSGRDFSLSRWYLGRRCMPRGRLNACEGRYDGALWD